MQTHEVQILKEFIFEELSVSFRSDGLVAVSIHSDNEVEIKHVLEVVSALKEYGKGKKFPLLITTQKYTLPSPEARAYIATAESDPFASAEAYVTQSFSQRLVGNVYMQFNKPARPTRIFNSEAKAIEWLKTFL